MSRQGGVRKEKSGSPAAPASTDGGAVVYTIGLSTDPYGNSIPGGFGVLLNPGGAGQKKLEIRNPDLGFFGGVDWIGERRILVPRDAPPFRVPLIFRLKGGRLVREGRLPLPPLDTQQEWSPEGELIASKPIEPCEPNQQPRWKCYRQVDEIYLQNADGSNRRAITTGRLESWTPDGRILIGVGNTFSRFEALSLSTGARTLPLRPAQVAKAAGLLGRASLGPPRWSADRRYIAALVAGKWPKKANVSHSLVIARADGTPIRVITSPYLISMFAWSPTGHRFAWTTSGFPDPHELFVLDDPKAKPRRLFATPARHFDWITWAPDGRRLLLDDENDGHWRMFGIGDGREQLLPRLGGRPVWCCPVNAYATFNY
ncbi:MAG: TolB family protein [Gaiellaceae bacterium]